MLFHLAFLLSVAGTLVMANGRTEGEGCSDSIICKAPLTCVKEKEQVFGFCKNVTAVVAGSPINNSTTAKPAGPPATTATVKPVSSGASTTLKTSARPTQSGKVSASAATMPTAKPANADPPVTQVTTKCQGEDLGCADHLPCCGGFVCAKGDDPFWGFCKEVTLPPHMVSTPAWPKNPLVTRDQFIQAVKDCGYPAPTDAQYANFIARAEPRGRITNKMELAMFLANMLHESDGLRAKREQGRPADRYNTEGSFPGQHYYGRGYTQLSYTYNYKSASFDLFGDDRLVRDPDQVASNDTMAWETSYWYWSTRVHDAPGVKEGQFGGTIKAINGGLECGDAPSNRYGGPRRVRFYRQILKSFGANDVVVNSKGCWTKNGQPMDIDEGTR